MSDYVACANERKRCPKSKRSVASVDAETFSSVSCSSSSCSSGDGRRMSEEYLIAAVEAPHHRLIDRLLLRRILLLGLLLLLLLILIRRIRTRSIRTTSVRIIRVPCEMDPLGPPPGRVTSEPKEAPVEEKRAPRRPESIASLDGPFIERRHEGLVSSPAPCGRREGRRDGGRCRPIARSLRQVIVIIVVLLLFLVRPLRLPTAADASTMAKKGRRWRRSLRPTPGTGRRLTAAVQVLDRLRGGRSVEAAVDPRPAEVEGRPVGAPVGQPGREVVVAGEAAYARSGAVGS